MTKIEEFLKANRISRNVFESALSLLVECINDGSQELKIEVEPELMTLQEALPKITEGVRFKKTDKNQPDDPSTVINKDGRILWESNNMNPVEMKTSNLKMIGKIIPAEPKVLTADYYWRNKVPIITNNTESFSERRKPDIIQAFEAGEENQYKNHKELREAVERFSMVCTDKTIKDMLAALKNIKPLAAE